MQIGDGSTAQAFRSLTLKKIIMYVLIALLYIVVILSVFEVALTLYRDITTPPLFLQISQLLDLLGLFLLILVAVELLDTVKAYLDEDIVHVEVVLEAAMIAVARKIIVLDIKETTSLTIIGIGFILLALAGGYYVVKSLHTRVTSKP